MEKKLQLPLRGSSLDIVSRCGPALGEIIHNKFGCVATFDGVDFKSDLSIAQQKKPTADAQKRFSVMLKSGVEVSVWKADLTKFPVDAVVNAANSKLEHCGGLALALSEAGGPKVQQESDYYIKKYGDVETGDAIILDPGLLPCKKIIHAVGPQLSRYHPNVSKAEPLLKKTIRSILFLVEENHLETVAIPAISSGLFHYPLPKCAEAIVLTVKEFYENRSFSGRLPKEIRLVNHDEPTVREMERACHQILDPKTSMSYSQAAAGGRSRGAAGTSTPTVKMGNVILTLKKGKIEEQQTDVIVNTISPSRDLKHGQISRAVLQKAGPELQKEIKSAPCTDNVISTKSYKLHCKEVYHTCCFGKRKDHVQQILFKSVLECLWRAAATQHKSISFPAIGTGGLSLSKTEAAWIMSDAVTNFAQAYPDVMEVCFVTSDDHTFKDFEGQMQSLHQKASSSFTPALEYRDDFRDTKPVSPQICLMACSAEALLEAKKWLSDLFRSSGTIHIYNNFIQHFGEKEYQQLAHLHQHIRESFVKGHASITVNGDSHEDVVVAGLQVEAMLCTIQMKFVTEEENTMLDAKLPLPTKTVSFERKTVNHNGPLFSDIAYRSKHQALQVVKAEKVENDVLEMLFKLKKNQIDARPQRMFQRIPAQFCEMVCQIGFHAEFAPPEDTAYGEGIYFARNVTTAMELWREHNEEYLYFVEAEVLTGNSTPGKQGLILPPALETNPQMFYDSVKGGNDIAVLFSSYQALPKHIITCKLVDFSTVSSWL